MSSNVNPGLARHFVSALILVFLAMTILGGGERAFAQPGAPTTAPSADGIQVTQSAAQVACYDFVEVTIRVDHPPAGNPFLDGSLAGTFGRAVPDAATQPVDGFCDAPDGTLWRIRFMPAQPGDYAYRLTYKHGQLQKEHAGRFTAVAAGRRGIVRTDPKFPWHFLWEGTGEHYYLNGTTAFLLLGWNDDKTIDACIDRLHALKINRIRLLLNGRTDHYWTEPVQTTKDFQPVLNPWPAKQPSDLVNPGFDFARMNTTYWQKFERMLAHARDKDMVISIIFGWNDTKAHPAANSEEERRYFRYAVARLGAYSNITWDLGDDLDSFRDEAWTHKMGTLLEEWDPYHHLATSHPVNNSHQDRKAPWFGMTSFQEWRRPIHQWMLDQRREQARTGRIIPQLNEEYGYEDHYPSWAPYKPPAASADATRRTAWEIAMAGCYQTTGETAKRGTGVAPDTGGGWINGRGDDTMVMLQGYAHMVDFFTALPWWQAEPDDAFVTNGAFCLAKPGSFYVIYLPRGGKVTVTIEDGSYLARWFNPRTGQYTALPPAQSPEWTSPDAPDKEDWVVLLQKGQPATNPAPR